MYTIPKMLYYVPYSYLLGDFLLQTCMPRLTLVPLMDTEIVAVSYVSDMSVVV